MRPTAPGSHGPSQMTQEFTVHSCAFGESAFRRDELFRRNPFFLIKERFSLICMRRIACGSASVVTAVKRTQGCFFNLETDLFPFAEKLQNHPSPTTTCLCESFIRCVVFPLSQCYETQPVGTLREQRGSTCTGSSFTRKGSERGNKYTQGHREC